METDLLVINRQLSALEGPKIELKDFRREGNTFIFVMDIDGIRHKRTQYAKSEIMEEGTFNPPMWKANRELTKELIQGLEIMFQNKVLPLVAI